MAFKWYLNDAEMALKMLPFLSGGLPVTQVYSVSTILLGSFTVMTRKYAVLM